MRRRFKAARHWASVWVLAAVAVGGCTTSVYPLAPAPSTSNQPASSPTASTQQRPAEAFGSTPSPTDQRVTWIGDALTIQARRLVAGDVVAGREVTYICGATLGVQEATSLLATAQRRPDSRIGGVVVVALGTFEAVDSGDLAGLFREIGPHRRAILVAPAVLSRAYPWVPEVNSLFRSAASSSPNISYVDWQQMVAVHPDLIAANGATFSVLNRGGQTWLDAINQAIEKAYGPTSSIVDHPIVGTR